MIITALFVCVFWKDVARTVFVGRLPILWEFLDLAACAVATKWVFEEMAEEDVWKNIFWNQGEIRIFIWELKIFLFYW